MTCEELKRYRKIRADILEHESKLKEEISEYKAKKAEGAGNTKEIEDIEETIKTLNGIIVSLKTEKKRLTDFLSSIKDEKMHDLIYLYYFKGYNKTFKQVMIEYDGTTDEKAIRNTQACMKRYVENRKK